MKIQPFTIHRTPSKYVTRGFVVSMEVKLKGDEAMNVGVHEFSLRTRAAIRDCGSFEMFRLIGERPWRYRSKLDDLGRDDIRYRGR